MGGLLFFAVSGRHFHFRPCRIHYGHLRLYVERNGPQHWVGLFAVNGTHLGGHFVLHFVVYVANRVLATNDDRGLLVRRLLFVRAIAWALGAAIEILVGNVGRVLEKWGLFAIYRDQVYLCRYVNNGLQVGSMG